MASNDPHLILTTFLPVLLFESAFAMDVHIFYKLFWQIIVLAVFGLAIATLLSGVMANMVFSYNWTWFQALMFGAIISATDPVAVVALLNDLGKLENYLYCIIFTIIIIMIFNAIIITFCNQLGYIEMNYHQHNQFYHQHYLNHLNAQYHDTILIYIIARCIQATWHNNRGGITVE